LSVGTHSKVGGTIQLPKEMTLIWRFFTGDYGPVRRVLLTSASLDVFLPMLRG